MVAAAEGPSLPGRILVGRAVRAATAAKAELVADPGAAAVQDALLRAAATVLPDGPPGACTLRGTVNGRDLDVVAELSAHAVGRPVRWSFRV
jgi:phage tail protein X